MAMAGSPIVLINRTDRILEFVADGQHLKLLPGENHGFNEGHSFFAKSQNPLQGSEDYHTLDYKSLVAVKGTEDDAYPLDESELQGIERFDRSTMPGAEKVAVLKARHQVLRGYVRSAAGAESQAIGN